jgi:glycosyltransferase involved in cell wall biosynthesis
VPNTRKKILFVSRWYPDRHDPMPGLFVRRHAEAVHLFADVTVLHVTADTTLRSGKIFREESIHGGIREQHVYFGKSSIGLINAWRYLKHYLQALSSLDSPDLVHVHVLSRTAIPALWLKYTRNIPYVVTEHWSRYLPQNVAKGAYRGWLRKWFTKLVVKNAKCITTVTQNLAIAMQQLGLKNRYVVTPNVADCGLFHPEEKTTQKDFDFVHVSCFDEPAKNIKGIVDAFAEYVRLGLKGSLTIIGDGPDYKSVFAYAEATKLVGSRISFTGLMEGEELASRMRKTDALVMFSNYENLPCTIVESLCCGVPVISTDVGGISEFVNQTNGILIQPREVPDLVSAMRETASGLFNGKKQEIAAYGSRHFSMESLSQNFKQVYKL